jgi:4-amino-4-deoxy-L-arabinose transferase-like glycosyltransferase
LIPILLFMFSLYQNLSNMDTVDFHRDEARWINRAYFARDYFDPFSDTWADYYITQGQPPLGNYLMGLGLVVQGRDLNTNTVWDFHYEEDWNILHGAMPEPADLDAGRRTNAVVGALVVVCVYLLTSRFTNRIGGVAAGLLMAIHPLHLRLSSQALSDELLALLLMLSFLMAWRFARSPGVGPALLLGALLGLGGAAKLSPLLLSIPLAIYGCVWLGMMLRRHGRPGIAWHRARFGWLLVAQPGIAYVVFVLANPFLWPNPIGRTLDIANFRRQEMDGQSAAWPIAGVDGPLTALQRTGRRFNLDYSSSLRIQNWWGGLWETSPGQVSLDVVIMCAGVVVLIALAIKSGLWSPAGITAFLMAASSAAIIVGMGVDFYRYFLPLLIVAATCFGIAVGSASNLIGRYMRRVHLPAWPGTRLNRGTISSAR